VYPFYSLLASTAWYCVQVFHLNQLYWASEYVNLGSSLAPLAPSRGGGGCEILPPKARGLPGPFQAAEWLSAHPKFSPFSPRLTPAHPTPSLVARVQGGLSLGSGGAELDADFGTLGK
jgi:hypothetical protein